MIDDALYGRMTRRRALQCIFFKHMHAYLLLARVPSS